MVNSLLLYLQIRAHSMDGFAPTRVRFVLTLSDQTIDMFVGVRN